MGMSEREHLLIRRSHAWERAALTYWNNHIDGCKCEGCEAVVFADDTFGMSLRDYEEAKKGTSGR